MFANDTIINFRNAIHETLEIHGQSNDQNSSGRDAGAYTGKIVSVGAGAESGFAAGMRPMSLRTDAYLFIRHYGHKDPTYRVWCENHEIGTPDVRIAWMQGSSWQDISGERDMDENTTFEITHRGYRFQVHRWSNGKEPLDDYDEWYTRFFVTMSFA